MRTSFNLILATLFLGVITAFGLSFSNAVQAQVFSNSANTQVIDLAVPASASATLSGSLATPSAEVQEKIQEKVDKDLTEQTGKQKSKLASYLDEHPLGEFGITNFLRTFIQRAIEQGLPANTVVLVLLFPLIATIIAGSHHLVGLQGFGIYTPAVLSVAFVSTGLLNGLILFMAVLLSAVVTRKVVKLLKLSYLPRTAMLLLGVSLVVLLSLMASTYFGLITFSSINIFPLLIVILLTENFMESQLFNSPSQAWYLTFETIFIAVFCSLIINSEAIQKFVLLNPELTILWVIVANLAIGKYTGLRLFEYFRFQKIIE